MKLASTIGKNAREAREELGLTQAQVAEEIGIPSSLYERIEQGQCLPSVYVLGHMARVLKTDLLRGMRFDVGKPNYHLSDIEVRRLTMRLRRVSPGAIRVVGALLDELDRLYTPDEP